MRSSIEKIRTLGVMPGDATADDQAVKRWEEAVGSIELPVSCEEATVLMGALPHDESSCFGLAWTMLHAIETAPGYGVDFVEQSAAVGPWRATLLHRLSNAARAAG
jgi:hypothetical protein